MPTLPRFGIVDMGSNAIRMMIAEASGSAIAILESHRLPLRLGRDVFESGQIPEATISAVVDAFRRFRASCDRMSVQAVRAIATSAMREARNREQVIDRVRAAANIDIEVISGTQEAYLLAQAVQTKIDLSRGRSVLVDVGGGSVEVVLVEDGQVTGADSYRLGALRMLATLPEPNASGETFVELLRQHLQGLERRIADRFDERRIDRFVAVGGNIETIAELLAARGENCTNNGIDTLPLAQLDSETMALARLSNEARIEKYGLKPDRADTIVPAGIVYARIGEIAGIEQVLVPRVGIKEGLLAELLAGHGGAFVPEEHVDTVLSACNSLGRKYHFEKEHAESVLRLARQIFDQTRELHGLDSRARVLLDAAALLHDLGVTVNNDGHHKHSQYLIQASEIVGLSEEERHLVALLVRYHRKAPPSRDHEEFAALRRRERSLVERLAAILRLADALDRQHAGLVRSLEIIVRDDVLELRPSLAPMQHSRLTLERQAIEEKGAYFGQLFGKRPLLLAP
ncbi:MAG: Ppx/GppA family phosphatase [Planctomycetes bacterium]|nr:Ppx/GppA family phosphatase [Planctomycetota bacterium]